VYLLGVDVGTSVIKTTLFDLQGSELCTAGQDTVIQHPQPLWAEADMHAVWQAVIATASEVMGRSAVQPSQVAAIGLTGQGDGTWLVDAQGQPVRPAILWLDGRAHALLGDLETRGASHEIFRITGTAPNTCNQGLQLRWLQENEPASIRSAQAALRAKDWVFLCMTGRTTTDETDASFTYFDIARRSVEPRLFELLGIPGLAHLVPEVLPSTHNRGELLQQAAERIGLLPGTPVIGGPFDVSASDLGAGAIQPGDACTILGTAGIHQTVLAQPEYVPENVGYNMCHAPADRWVRLFPTMSATLNLQWFVETFYAREFDEHSRSGENPWAYLEQEASQVPLGCEGVVYHPYIDPAGERAPFLFPAARAQFSGLSLHCRRETLLRAVYEGVVLSAVDCYSMLPERITHLKLGGGGSRSEFWAQMFADALGCPVSTTLGKEPGARGAAINAGVAVGLFPSFEAGVAAMVHPRKQYQPDLANTQNYQELYRLYRLVYQAAFPVWEAGAQFRNKLPRN
jgi:sugar (pentulose or hexulose) kinase